MNPKHVGVHMPIRARHLASGARPGCSYIIAIETSLEIKWT
jgi:hypothetical protein